MKYPFRYNDANVGDKVFWVCDVYHKGVPTPTVVEAIITHKSDSFEYAARDLSDPTQTEENWAIFYEIDKWDNNGLMFGIDLFLTEEEAFENL